MKVLRLSLLLALLSSSTVLAAPVPVEMAGSYQALLFTNSGDTGSPAGLIALTVSTKGAVSGKLTTNENKTYAFKTTLDYTAAVTPEEGDPIGTAVHTAAIPIKRGKLSELSLELVFQNFSATEQTFTATLTGEIAGGTEEGFKVKTYAPKTSAPTLGAYTMAFELANEPDQDEPAGSGYAVGKIDAKGILKLTGKTGDGTAFTASLPNGPDDRFVMFVNPYKRAGSFLAGKIQLTARGDDLFHMLPAEVGFDFQWQKAAGEKDKSYREGFGPMDLLASIEPWIAPGKGQTLGGILNIDLDESFDVAFSGGLPSSRTPTTLALDIKNNLQVVTGASGSPSTLIGTGWAKIFSGKIDPKTGKVTMTVNLEDSVPTSNPLRPKLVKRKVLIEGVVLQVEVEGEEDFRFAPGFMLIPPLDAKTGTISSFALEFQGPAALNALYAAAGELAGTYTALTKLETVTPSGSPSTPFVDEGTSTFTISADLKTLTIGGRKLPLMGDSRPVSIVYTDAQTKFTNYYTVQIFLNFEGKPTGMFITHNQTVLGVPPVVKNIVFSSATIVKQ